MINRVIIPCICLLTLLASFSGCFDIDIPDELVQFSITSFRVEPGIINQGETANLSWMVIGATSVSIDNDIGNVSLFGERIIMPSKTTTYTLTATNATTNITATVQIIVKLLRDVYLTINNTGSNISLTIGDTVNLTLEFNAGTGYVWEIIQLDEQILNITEKSTWGDTEVVGGLMHDTWIFTAKNTGNTTLELVFYRPWEDLENATKTFIAYIDVN
ncbi:MAG: protease inhibitor I42 family protein [Thermoplasmatales archaeon]|nr:MAG: protease inhibitor I42 family protein [Thermoplasmatales archaeon]